MTPAPERVGPDPYTGHKVNRLRALVYIAPSGDEGVVGVGGSSGATGVLGAAVGSTQEAEQALRDVAASAAETVEQGGRLVLRIFTAEGFSDELLVGG